MTSTPAEPIAPPAPLPAARLFYLHAKGEPQGPMDRDAILRLVSARQLRLDDLINEAGTPGWIALRDHPDFAPRARHARPALAAPIRDMPLLADPFRRICASATDFAIVSILQTIAGRMLYAALMPRLRIPSVHLAHDPVAILTSILSQISAVALIGFTMQALIYAAYYTLFLVSPYQATPGKLLFGMHVARADGAPITMADALKRCTCYLLDALTLSWGYLLSFSNDDRRALHDRICDTDVLDGPCG
ncbi:MAG TPA: RDD family protein [Beijerinckiaceae bacterium]|nr:RDD family protein [Rhodoblastus sp.]MCC2106195.1 RDD family protein [Hyphomicrobiales bacterium]HRY04318.1 RDD family protein [Beijerinckiaceae bacterium]